MHHQTVEGGGSNLLTTWLCRARRGDSASFDRLCHPLLVQRWLLTISASLPKHLRTKVDPEDILQDSLQRVWTSIGNLNEVTTRGFHGWVLRIIHNVTTDAIRQFDRQKRCATREQPLEFSTDKNLVEDTAPASMMANRDRVNAVVEVLDELPEPYRQVIVHTILEGRSAAEVSTLIGLSQNNVRVIRHRGLTRLVQLLEDKSLDSTVFRSFS